MSADNGVYLLECKDEILVTHASAIENLWWNDETKSNQGELNWKYVFEYFQGSQVFQNKGNALLYAHQIAESLPVCE